MSSPRKPTWVDVERLVKAYAECDTAPGADLRFARVRAQLHRAILRFNDAQGCSKTCPSRGGNRGD